MNAYNKAGAEVYVSIIGVAVNNLYRRYEGIISKNSTPYIDSARALQGNAAHFS